MTTNFNISPLLELLVTRQKRRILLVDDDRLVVETLGVLLEAMGQKMLVIWDSRTAIAAAIDFRPHVAILDLDMPGISGFDLAEQMRQMPDLKRVGLIALSGWNTQATRDRCRECGFDRFFAKPTSLDQIFFALSEYD